MDKSTHQIRCEQWLRIISECAKSGMNKTAWCKANGISDKSFFYWQRILRNESYLETVTNATPAVFPHSSDEITFVEVKADTYAKTPSPGFTPDVVIHAGHMTVELSNRVSPALLQMIGGLLHAE